MALGALALATLSLAACASGRYTAPDVPGFETSKTAEQPYQAAFDAVLRGAPGLGFEIIEADPTLGEIKMRFGERSPERYVTCGRYVGGTGTTSFRGDWVRWVTNTRSARLTGLLQVRLNALDDDSGQERTQAAVRAGYALTLPASIAPGFAGADFTFASDSSDTVTILDALEPDRQRTCQASGLAEAEILALIG